MSRKPEEDSEIDRRKFLELAGVAGSASELPFVGAASGTEKPAAPGKATHNHAPMPENSRLASVGYEFFNTNGSTFIEAAVDTLIPAVEVGPGAVEAGVPTYIDRQMAGAYGKGDRLYLEGPFREGAPQQGYQLAMMLAELIRIGIADVNSHTRKKFNKAFDALATADRIAVMMEVDAGDIELPNAPTDTFFGLLLQLTIEGYFADPMYGGNGNKASWKMIGFPGANAMDMDKIEPFRNGATRPNRWAFRTSHSCSTERGDINMGDKLNPVDVSIIGLGWTGGIIAKELADSGLDPQIHDELRYAARHDLMQNVRREALRIAGGGLIVGLLIVLPALKIVGLV